MEEDAPHRLRWPRVIARVAGYTLLAVALYVLSLGPVIYLFAYHSSPVERGAEVFYEPLFWLDQHTDLLDPLGPYFDWWSSLPRSPFDRQTPAPVVPD